MTDLPEIYHPKSPVQKKLEQSQRNIAKWGFEPERVKEMDWIIRKALNLYLTEEEVLQAKEEDDFDRICYQYAEYPAAWSIMPDTVPAPKSVMDRFRKATEKMLSEENDPCKDFVLDISEQAFYNTFFLPGLDETPPHISLIDHVISNMSVAAKEGRLSAIDAARVFHIYCKRMKITETSEKGREMLQRWQQFAAEHYQTDDRTFMLKTFYNLLASVRPALPVSADNDTPSSVEDVVCEEIVLRPTSARVVSNLSHTKKPHTRT